MSLPAVGSITMSKNKTGHLEIFPKVTSVERPIPPEIWPDLPGVITAKVVTWEPTLAKWKEFIKVAARFPLVSIDTETSGLRPFHGSKISGVAMAFYDGKDVQAGYWNFRHQGHAAHPWCKLHLVGEDGTPLPKKDLKKNIKKGCKKCAEGWCEGYKETAPVLPVDAMGLLRPLFKDVIIAGQNFKFDIKLFWVDGIEVPLRVLDTLLIAHLWDENKRGFHLAGLAQEMGEQKLGDTIKEYMDFHDLPLNHPDPLKGGHAQVPFVTEAPYAVRDTVLVLKRLQWERSRWLAANDPKLIEVFQVENGCTPAFATMEINGLKLDMKYVSDGIEKLDGELADLTTRIYKEAGKELDINSTQQLWQILEARGLKPLATTPNGAPSLGANEMESYAANGDELCQMVLDYRSRYKNLNTYLKPFRDDHADADHLIHSDFFIAGTVSGRTSCREPNLQNVTRIEAFTASKTMRGATAKMIQDGNTQFEDHSEEKIQVRRCFVPRTKDHSLFFFDYSQMELRIFAEYAEETFMLKALEANVDIHEAVAREIFPDFPDKEKNPLLHKFFRQLTKQINFGIIYGMGKNKLALQLNVPVDETVRMLKMVIKTRETNRALGDQCCTLTDEEIMAKLEDHRIMTAARQWAGLGAMGKDVFLRVNPDPMAEYLFKDGQNMGLMYSADSFLKKYHNRFPTIKKFTKGLDPVIGRRGYIFNRYGRRYHMRPDEAYIGVNRLVQGTTADQVKVADWRVDRLLRGTKSFLLNNVHDELQFDIHHQELHLVPLIKEAMEYYPNIGVKMLVEVDYSHLAWSDKHKWEGEEKFMASIPKKAKRRTTK